MGLLSSVSAQFAPVLSPLANAPTATPAQTAPVAGNEISAAAPISPVTAPASSEAIVLENAIDAQPDQAPQATPPAEESAAHADAAAATDPDPAVETDGVPFFHDADVLSDDVALPEPPPQPEKQPAAASPEDPATPPATATTPDIEGVQSHASTTSSPASLASHNTAAADELQPASARDDADLADARASAGAAQRAYHHDRIITALGNAPDTRLADLHAPNGSDKSDQTPVMHRA